MRYKKGSHIRSVLKGISWRIIASTTTVLVALVITCVFGQCDIEKALQIGGIEFLIKLAIYYLHERVWENCRRDGVMTKQQTLFKTLSWRIVATTTTFVISGAVMEIYNEIALFIALTELIAKFVLYYFHERLWLRIPLGRIRNYFVKFLKK